MKRLDELGVSPAQWQATSNDAETTTWVFSRTTTADVATMCASKRERCNADARLIAAAPDLYEALRESVEKRCVWCARKDGSAPEVCAKCDVPRWRKALEKAGG